MTLRIGRLAGVGVRCLDPSLRVGGDVGSGIEGSGGGRRGDGPFVDGLCQRGACGALGSRPNHEAPVGVPGSQHVGVGAVGVGAQCAFHCGTAVQRVVDECLWQLLEQDSVGGDVSLIASGVAETRAVSIAMPEAAAVLSCQPLNRQSVPFAQLGLGLRVRGLETACERVFVVGSAPPPGASPAGFQ